MMRNQGVAAAAGLVPFGHLGWGFHTRAEFLAQAAEYIADGLAHNQRIVYVGEASRAALEAELAGMPGVGDRLDTGAVIALPSAQYYKFRPGRGIVDPEATTAKSVKATHRAIEDGYTGLRAGGGRHPGVADSGATGGHHARNF
jgi:hypothetical protein